MLGALLLDAPAPASSSPASSRPRRRSWPRASRTRRSTATRGCSRSTTWAVTPARFGIAVDAFHAANWSAPALPAQPARRQTHDTKRSADVRARIGALASMAARVGRARAALVRAEPLRAAPGPDPVEEYFLFQTLVGAWPIEPDRLEAYWRRRCARPSATTSWIEPDRGGRTRSRLRARLYDTAVPRDFEPFAARVAAGRRARGARPAAAQADRARACPTSTTATSCRLALAGGPRQPPAGRLGRAARALAARRRARTPREAVADRGALALRARRPEAFTAPTAARRGPGACARSRGRGRGARGGARARDARARRSTCRRGWPARGGTC